MDREPVVNSDGQSTTVKKAEGLVLRSVKLVIFKGTSHPCVAVPSLTPVFSLFCCMAVKICICLRHPL